MQDSPISSLKKELQRKNDVIAQKQEELDHLRIQMGQVVSTNELLKLQIQDLVVTVNNLRGQCDQVLNNLYVLQSKLPTIQFGDEE